jgi:hypothetical protein
MASVIWLVPTALLPKLTDEMEQAVTEYLAAQVPPITATKVDIIGGPYRLVINANADPTSALNAYTGQPTAIRDRYEKAKATLDTYVQNFTPATATNDQKALYAVIIVVQRMLSGAS